MLAIAVFRLSVLICTHQLILFGENSLRRVVSDFVEHYHQERNYQGKKQSLTIRCFCSRYAGSPGRDPLSRASRRVTQALQPCRMSILALRVGGERAENDQPVGCYGSARPTLQDRYGVEDRLDGDIVSEAGVDHEMEIVTLGPLHVEVLFDVLGAVAVHGFRQFDRFGFASSLWPCSRRTFSSKEA